MTQIKNTILVLASAVMLFSCSSSKQSTFTKRKYYHFRHGATEVAMNKTVTKERKSTVTPTIATQKNKYTQQTIKSNVRSVENALMPVADNSKENKTSNPIKQKKMTTSELKKLIKQAVVSTKKNNDALNNDDLYNKGSKNNNRANVGLIILAIILPPLAVYLYERGTKDHFWLSVLLTILFWFPGIVFALMIIFDAI